MPEPAIRAERVHERDTFVRYRHSRRRARRHDACHRPCQGGHPELRDRQFRSRRADRRRLRRPRLRDLDRELEPLQSPRPDRGTGAAWLPDCFDRGDGRDEARPDRFPARRQRWHARPHVRQPRSAHRDVCGGGEGKPDHVPPQCPRGGARARRARRFGHAGRWPHDQGAPAGRRRRSRLAHA